MKMKLFLKQVLSDSDGIPSTMRLSVLITVIGSLLLGTYASVADNQIAKEISLTSLGMALLGKTAQKQIERIR